jgi:hypothetical protein
MFRPELRSNAIACQQSNETISGLEAMLRITTVFERLDPNL